MIFRWDLMHYAENAPSHRITIQRRGCLFTWFHCGGGLCERSSEISIPFLHNKHNHKICALRPTICTNVWSELKAYLLCWNYCAEFRCTWGKYYLYGFHEVQTKRRCFHLEDDVRPSAREHWLTSQLWSNCDVSRCSKKSRRKESIETM